MSAHSAILLSAYSICSDERPVISPLLSFIPNSTIPPRDELAIAVISLIILSCAGSVSLNCTRLVSPPLIKSNNSAEVICLSPRLKFGIDGLMIMYLFIDVKFLST